MAAITSSVMPYLKSGDSVLSLNELYGQLYDITRESVISIYGTLKKKSISKAGMEILGIEIEILSIAETPLPLGVIDRVSADLDTRLNNRFPRYVVKLVVIVHFILFCRYLNSSRIVP